jgi:Spy/CpxP family protein refolding chaperone
MKPNQTLMIAALIAGGVCAASVAVRAQDTTTPPTAPAQATAPAPATPAAPATAPAHPPGAPVVRNRFEMIAQRLALSDDQKAKAKPVFEEVAQKQAAVRADTSLDPVARRAKIKEIQADASNQLKEILTPEQFDKWQKMQPVRRPVPRPPAAATGTNAPTPPQ